MRKSILGLLVACAMAAMLVGVVACGGGGQQGSAGSSAKPSAAEPSAESSEAQSLFTDDGFPNPSSMSKALAKDASSLYKQLDAEYPNLMAGSAHEYYANEDVRTAAEHALNSSSLKEGEWVLYLDTFSDYVRVEETIKISGNVDAVAGILSRNLGVNLSSSDFEISGDRYHAQVELDGQTVMHIFIPNGGNAAGLVIVQVERDFA